MAIFRPYGPIHNKISLGDPVGLNFVPAVGNVITNWQLAGAVPGIIGSGGVLPTGSSSGLVAGVTLEVVSTTQYKGGNLTRLRFAGTATAAGSLFIYFGSLTNPTAPGEVWRQQVFINPIGGQTPGGMSVQGQWRNSGTFFGVMNGALGTGPITALTRPADSPCPAGANQAGFFLFRSVALSNVVNIDFELFAPQLFKV